MSMIIYVLILILLYGLGFKIYKETILILNHINKGDITLLKTVVFLTINTPILILDGGSHAADFFVLPSLVGIPYLYLFVEGPWTFMVKSFFVSITAILTFTTVYTVFKIKDGHEPKQDRLH